MFYVRIVLIVGKSIDFDGITDFETVVFQKEHIKCLINKKDTLLTRRIIYSYGPFLDSKDAKQEGYKLYIKIIKSYILKKIPISINDNIAINDVSQISIQNASTSNEGREIIRKKLNIPEGIEIFDEVLGLGIYELQGDISSAKFLIVEDFFYNVLSMSAYMKAYEDKKSKKRFYDEREWRYLYIDKSLELIYQIYVSDMHNFNLIKRNEVLQNSPLKFEINDLQNIFLTSKEEKCQLVDFLINHEMYKKEKEKLEKIITIEYKD